MKLSNLVIECLPTMHEALGLIPSTAAEEGRKERREGGAIPVMPAFGRWKKKDRGEWDLIVY